ncbi:MAG: FtsK/SpoIIIE domain-containing protein [Oligoflexales bacterium]
MKNNGRLQIAQSNVKDSLLSSHLNEFVVISGMGVWVLIKSLISIYAPITIGILSGMCYLTYQIASSGQHIQWIHHVKPELFSIERLDWMWGIPVIYHCLFLYLTVLSPIVLFLGMWARGRRTKYQKVFQSIGLTNGHKDTPKLLKFNRFDRFRKNYLFDANGIGLSEFEEKKERLEANFRSNIESIKLGPRPGLVLISFNDKKFPDSVKYTDLAASTLLPRDSFFIGQSTEGTITQAISELPHMLIAGTTGSGKSVAFKQILMGLLESSKHLQMYLVDLKGGVEMIDFVKCPNVKVVKTMEDALIVLRMVEKEMKERFRYLEECNRKQIVPEIDKKDRIVVGVDECSVLYMNRPRNDPEYEDALEARQLADSICKLSRAASIHMILATQKLDRQVIPTSVSENISGRLAFRANSLQGSLIVLGSKDACELPEIPGRGIWSFGTKKVTVQAPYIEEKIIKSRSENIAKLFATGKKKLLNPMLGDAAKFNSKRIKKVYSQLKEHDNASKQK